jgi:prepilin-type N-terminal cleavage/methylation domain-containing protein
VRGDRVLRRGFSLLELVVAIALISILVGVFLERALYYKERLEKSKMEEVAMDLRSSVNLRVAELVLENRAAELVRLAEENPMELMVQKPANYLGVLKQNDKSPLPAPGWYYDNRVKEVVYYVDLGRYFSPDAEGEKRASWRIVLSQGGNGQQLPQWARLEPARPYRWFAD